MNFLTNFLTMASSYARPLTNLVRRRWLRTLIWALALCLVVFFYGDSIRLRHWQPFDTDTAAHRDLHRHTDRLGAATTSTWPCATGRRTAS